MRLGGEDSVTYSLESSYGMDIKKNPIMQIKRNSLIWDTSRLTCQHGETIFDTEGFYTCLMCCCCNAPCRKEVLTHCSSVPSSGARWEGGRISAQYLQWPLPLTGQGPMGTNCRRQTMNNGVQGWAVVPVQHAPFTGMWITPGWAGWGSRHASVPSCRTLTWTLARKTCCFRTKREIFIFLFKDRNGSGQKQLTLRAEVPKHLLI